MCYTECMKREYLKRRMSYKEQVFWGRHTEKLNKYGIEGRNAEWHICRTQDFDYSLDGLKLLEVSSVYVDSYLTVIGRNAKFPSGR